MTDNMIISFFNKIDTDGDGFVTFSELESAAFIPVNHNGIIYESDKDINLCFRIQSYLKTLRKDYRDYKDYKISLFDLIQ